MKSKRQVRPCRQTTVIGRTIVPLDISTMTMGEILSIAIRLEEEGITFYRMASQKAHSKHLRDTLNILADDETEHKMVFQGIGRDLGLDLTDGHHSTTVSHENMDALVDAGIFPRREDREAAIASLHSPAQALRFAIRVEQGSVIFYETAARVVQSSDVRDVLNRVLVQERQHVRLLTAELKALKVSEKV
jgi:rubrerythrin